PNHPSLTPNAVKAMLHYTALRIHDDNGIEYDPLREGAGALNTKGAIDLGRKVNTAAPTGTYWLTSQPSPWTVIDGQALAWSQAILWGTTIMQGSPVSVNEAAWGTAILWGTNAPWASAILWGTNVVWSDPQSWANAILWGTSMVGYDNGSAILW